MAPLNILNKKMLLNHLYLTFNSLGTLSVSQSFLFHWSINMKCCRSWSFNHPSTWRRLKNTQTKWGKEKYVEFHTSGNNYKNRPMPKNWPYHAMPYHIYSPHAHWGRWLERHRFLCRPQLEICRNMMGSWSLQILQLDTTSRQTNHSKSMPEESIQQNAEGSGDGFGILLLKLWLESDSMVSWSINRAFIGNENSRWLWLYRKVSNPCC